MINFPIKYKNGNYDVVLLSDGTKIKKTEDDIFIPTRPETIDINISNFCVNNCPFCYIDATVNGKHGDLNHKLFDEIPEFTEVALNYCRHPGLIDLLYRLRDRNIIVNFTVNQIDFVKDSNLLHSLQERKLFYGLGISIPEIHTDLIELIDDYIPIFKNVVIHTIAGITDNKSFEFIKNLCNKVLILGYKTKGRGNSYNPKFGKLDIQRIFKTFDIVSFDNLALEQLNIKDIVSSDVWSQNYMGKEGEFSFYIDMVDLKFYKSSIEENGFHINDLSVQNMFDIIRNVAS